MSNGTCADRGNGGFPNGQPYQRRNPSCSSTPDMAYRTANAETGAHAAATAETAYHTATAAGATAPVAATAGTAADQCGYR